MELVKEVRCLGEGGRSGFLKVEMEWAILAVAELIEFERRRNNVKSTKVGENGVEDDAGDEGDEGDPESD